MSGKRAAKGGDKNPARAKKALGEDGVVTKPPGPVATFDGHVPKEQDEVGHTDCQVTFDGQTPKEQDEVCPHCHIQHPGDAPLHYMSAVRDRCRHGEIPDMCVPCLTQQRQDVEKKLDVARRRKNSAWTSTHKCDGCGVFRPRGIRYVCTECDNTDICQKCVDEDIHMEHALIQIKYAHQHIGGRRRASYGDDGWARLQ